MKLDNKTAKRKLGDIGENIACDYLKKHNFEIIDRNYLRKWGEIDIIAKKGDIYRFIEVKSVCLSSLEPLPRRVSCPPAGPGRAGVTLPDVSHVTPKGNDDTYRPEENVHPQKLKRLVRTIQTYLLEKRIDRNWQLDVITVKIVEKDRIARVEMIENIII